MFIKKKVKAKRGAGRRRGTKDKRPRCLHKSFGDYGNGAQVNFDHLKNGEIRRAISRLSKRKHLSQTGMADLFGIDRMTFYHAISKDTKKPLSFAIGLVQHCGFSPEYAELCCGILPQWFEGWVRHNPMKAAVFFDKFAEHHKLNKDRIYTIKLIRKRRRKKHGIKSENSFIIATDQVGNEFLSGEQRD
jgi:hypothetical protein